MLQKRLIAPGAIIAAGAGAFWGGFPGERVVMDALQGITKWINTVAAHPELFIAFVFLFFGYVVVPNLVRIWNWLGDWETFRLREQQLSESKDRFHALANKA